MIGFPGARYDYRDWIDRHNERYPLPPVGIGGRPRIGTPRGHGAQTAARKDAVIIGLGWTGSILAEELTRAGLDVVAIERGPWRDTATDFPTTYAQDELRYRIRHDLFLRPAQETMTFRNNASQTALPIRSWGSFMPPNGVGGGGVHWNAETWRFLPSDFELKTHLTAALRREASARGHDDPGLGRHLRRARTLLRQIRISLRHLGQGRQHQRREAGRRQSVRRRRARAISDAAAEAALRPDLFAEAAREMGYQPVPAAFRQSLAGLYQSARA